MTIISRAIDYQAILVPNPERVHGGIISAEQPQVIHIDSFRNRLQISRANTSLGQVRSYTSSELPESTCQVYALDPITVFRLVSAYRPRFRLPGYLFEDRDSRDSNKQDGGTNFRRDV
jgi:hypothetical protein